MTDFEKYDRVRALRFDAAALELLDQRKLPREETFVACASAEEVAQAIRDLVVRGAPAIGIAAAYGIVLAARELEARRESVDAGALAPSFDVLARSRPTAVNLFWALARMQRVAEEGADAARLEVEARAIESEDLAANRHMGELGAALIHAGSGIVTHCNTGSLATAGYGTALGVIRAAYAQGKVTGVYAGETRPWLQGSRLTVWELLRDAIPAKLMVDSAAAHLMSTGGVHWVVVGADRIAANGDTANKIGTYSLAIAARHH
ncbi:MAG TPA: S-methyl-5-thioribose-1-phosphate isomerase, partial [Candidatus Saccharimonadia bacterium]|nr:S-methyl-5-thioribose-1-phosphate isomerase [Candidatus Saccharimonadia bacterium]